MTKRPSIQIPVSSARRTRWGALVFTTALVAGLVAWSGGGRTSSRDTDEVAGAPYPLPSHFVIPTADVPAVPVRVIVPRLGIDLPVVPGVYDRSRDTWNVSNDVVQFATVTTQPNRTRGMTLLYAHNSRRLFGPLANVRPEDRVRVATATGEIFEYAYFGGDVTHPTDTAVFQDATGGPPRLVLLTCSGSWNRERRLLRFALLPPQP